MNFFGAGACFGGRGFDPSGVDADGDEVEGITVPGLKFREKVEDFWGADNGGATTTRLWEEEGVDSFATPGFLFDMVRWSATDGIEGKTNDGTFVKVLDWLVEREWRESIAVEDEVEGKDDVDKDNWLRECCFAIDAGAFLSW